MQNTATLIVILACGLTATGCSKPKQELPDIQLACSGTLTRTTAQQGQATQQNASDKSENYLVKKGELPDSDKTGWILDTGSKKFFTSAPKSRLNVDDRNIRYTADALESIVTTAHGNGKKRVATVIEIDRVSGGWMVEHRVEKEFANGFWENDIEQTRGQCERTDRKF